MIRRLLGLDRRDDDGVCPGCGRYDWPEQPVVPEPCGCGGHATRSCSSCGFSVTAPEPGPDCD